jgi:hypothetical protein
MFKTVNRREFLKILSLGIMGCSVPREAFALMSNPENYDDYIRDYLFIVNTFDISHKDDAVDVSDYLFTMNKYGKPQSDNLLHAWDYLFNMNSTDETYNRDVVNEKEYQTKMKNFNKPHKDDIFVNEADYSTFKSALKRIKRVQQVMGHGHFQLLSLDDAIKAGRNHSSIGKFTEAEMNFMEMVFYKEASLYGFFGQKTLKNITQQIKSKEVFKVPYTGNYIYKGVPLEMYNKIKKQVGKKVTLTSGVRGIMKQFQLFLNKAYKKEGNLSLASRSLAPPGYSFHGNGDFDVGKAGFGIFNFTARFTTTDIYKRLCDLGYLKLRYPKENYLGVRFEPWHIKTSRG